MLGIIISILVVLIVLGTCFYMLFVLDSTNKELQWPTKKKKKKKKRVK